MINKKPVKRRWLFVHLYVYLCYCLNKNKRKKKSKFKTKDPSNVGEKTVTVNIVLEDSPMKIDMVLGYIQALAYSVFHKTVTPICMPLT